MQLEPDKPKHAMQARASALTRTPDEMIALWDRREKAAELHALGKSYGEIARTLGTSKATAWTDVRAYFREAARYYRAPEFREKIATVYGFTIRAARREFQKLPDLPDYAEQRMKCLDRIHKALDGLRAAYGLMGENTFRLESPISPADAATATAAAASVPEWTRKLSPEKVRAARDAMFAFLDQIPREAVPAAVVVEEGAAPVTNGGGEPPSPPAERPPARLVGI